VFGRMVEVQTDCFIKMAKNLKEFLLDNI
jgi:hypothetical protein